MSRTFPVPAYLMPNKTFRHLKQNLEKKGRVFSVYWTADLYSTAHILRQALGVSRYQVALFYSDHGITPAEVVQEHELKNRARLYLTWHRSKFDQIAGQKRAIRIKHPYVYFRQHLYQPNNVKPEYVTYFLAHSISSKKLEYTDMWGALAAHRKRYGDSFRICVHHHDEQNGIADKLRERGYSVVCAGDTSYSEFVQNLYEILLSSCLVMSNTFGSYAFYALEARVPFTYDDTMQALVIGADGARPLSQADDRLTADFEKAANDDTFRQHILDRFMSVSSGVSIDTLNASELFRPFFHPVTVHELLRR